jgi:hypothetical protein
MYRGARHLCRSAAPRRIPLPGLQEEAGSSLPVTQRMPPIELPPGAWVREGLCLGVDGPDGYNIHCLEALQGFVERRARSPRIRPPLRPRRTSGKANARVRGC